jgi:hypothetical protein
MATGAAKFPSAGEGFYTTVTVASGDTTYATNKSARFVPVPAGATGFSLFARSGGGADVVVDVAYSAEAAAAGRIDDGLDPAAALEEKSVRYEWRRPKEGIWLRRRSGTTSTVVVVKWW